MNPLLRVAGRVYATRWAVLPPVVGVSMLAMIIGAVIAAPRELVEGEVQRVMYIHVPSANAMYLAFGIVAIASALYLWKRDMRYDTVARAAATVGVLFTALTLATGSIWGHPTWGAWWVWDARLTSTLLLFLLYTGYLLARSLSDADDEGAARYSAVFAILACLDIPIIQMSVRWWRTLHPQPIVMRVPGDAKLPDEMLLVLAISGVGIICSASGSGTVLENEQSRGQGSSSWSTAKRLWPSILCGSGLAAIDCGGPCPCWYV